MQIRNVARLDFSLAGRAVSVESTAAVVTVQAAPSRSTIEILRYAPGGANNSTAGPTACGIGAVFNPLPAPQVAGGGAIDPLAGVPLGDAPMVHAGDAAFIRLTDQDRNLDGARLDVIDLRVSAVGSGDSELLRLTETGPNTGVFTGYVPTRLTATGAGASADCALEVVRDAEIAAVYVDPLDATDVSRDTSLVDPSGVVFDSTTGARVNGARVRLVDAATGQPASVFGDDGVSRFPAEILTGEAATDSGGTRYDFPAGAFRFPLVAPGRYRLIVEPPRGLAAPSIVPPAALVSLPGGPYRLQNGSFGLDFDVLAPAGAALDVPVDPVSTALTLAKSTTATTVAIGDVLQYQLRLTNDDARSGSRGIVIEDRLPPGLQLRAGSVRIGGAAAADPVVTGADRTLRFSVPPLAPRQTLTISYVVDVVPAPRARELINTAQASALGGALSNIASARVALREDFFRERGFVLGRVHRGGCAADGTEGQGGIRVYLEDGRYAVTDVSGRYHFEDLAPGTHVVQVDTETLPAGMKLARCQVVSRDGGRDYSRFVELRAGELQQVDFMLEDLPPPKGGLRLELSSELVAEHLYRHRLKIAATSVPLANLRLMIMLPESFELESPKRSVANSVWTEAIGDLAGGAQRELIFATRRKAPDGVQPELRALALYDTPGEQGLRSAPATNRYLPGAPPPAVETVQLLLRPKFAVLGTDLAMDDSAALTAIANKYRKARIVKAVVAGHADSTPISARNRRMFADNLALSRGRAEAVARWLQKAFALPADAIVVEAYGDQQPLEPGKDPASLAKNRRVELELQLASTAEAVTSTAAVTAPEQWSDSVNAATVGSWRAPPKPASRAANAEGAPASAAIDTQVAIDRLAPEFAWLQPVADFAPSIPSLKVAVAHRYGTRVELRINKLVVSQLNFDGVETDRANKVHVSRWRGIDLRDGDNLLEARLIDPSDTVVETLERHVHYGGGAVRAELVKNQSALLADGRARPVIVLRLFDAYGRAARPGTRGLFRVDAPYRSQWEVEQLDDNPLLTAGVREPQFEVDADGLARLELEPTSQAGFAVLHLRFNERRDQELRVWLAPAAREFVMVGVASGTVAHQVLSANIERSPAMLEALAREGVEEGESTSGRVSFFAKGRIRGDFLLTVAYDSARDRDAARQRLKGVIEPDRYYLLYGDGTEQREEAASGEKLFLKLERRQFVALFGDYDTGFTVTELGRYSRSLTGLKADYGGEQFALSAFAARTDLGQVRDQFPADGTSGAYRLSRAPIVVGSDKLRIEVRDRFNAEKIVSTRTLSRFLDYRIDYDAGTVRFRDPVASRDQNFNPVTIIVDYETPGQGVETTSAGARVTLRPQSGRVEVGATLVQDGALAGDGRLAAVDAKWQLAAATELRAEVARSESDDPSQATGATAWLAELRHVDERLEVRAYARSEDDGFGLGQQFAGLAGSRKLGGDVRWQWNDRWSLQAQAFLQDSLESDAERQLAQAELRYQTNGASLGVGLEHADDAGPDGVARRSDIVNVNGSYDLFERKLTLRSTLSAPLGKDSSVDYPARSLLGIDYHLPRATTLFAEWEHGSGAQLDTDMARIGLRSQPFDRTQFVSSVTQSTTEYGPRVASNIGLSQGWQLTPEWSIDAGFEQSNTLRGAALVPQNPDLPLAAGSLQDDFVALFGGAQYHREDWTLAARLEQRHADSEDRWLATAGWYRAERGGHALSLAAEVEQRDALLAGEEEQLDLRFAWAFRPDARRWIVLNRLDLQRDARNGGLSKWEALKLVDNLHANWQWNSRTQLGLQLGLKRAITTFDRDRYGSNSALLALDLRRDLNARVDVGLHLATLRHLTADSSMDQLGIDVGFAPVRNLWLALGYNFRGFEERDFSAGRAQHQGPYLQLRVKVDQDSFKDLRLDALRAPARRSGP